jgi:lysophospholipase L1-like esterase
MAFHIDLTRYEQTIVTKEKFPVEEGKIILYGSSFWGNWGYERSQRQLSGLGGEERAVLNHGFGGATADELLYYYPRMIRPYAPKMIVWRGGPNDLGAGLSPEEAWSVSLRVFEWVKKDFPGIKIVIVGIFDYPSARESMRPLFADYNRYSKAYADANEHVFYADFNDFFYESKEDIGSFQHFRDVFVQDGLHLTDQAYEDLAVYFKGKIEPILAPIS